MTAAIAWPAGAFADRDGGSAARRAVVRWAWRMFRREWRQQLLVLGLIVVAVAATVLGAAVSINTPVPVAATFGTAQDLATVSGAGGQLAARIGSLQQRFAPIDVIEDRALTVPGSVDTFELRAQDPHGPYGRSLLSLVSGRFPSGAAEVAVTPGLAAELRLQVGSTWSVGGASRRVVGLVRNPEELRANFALVAPGQVDAPTQTRVLFDAPGLAPGKGSDGIGPNGQRVLQLGPGITVQLRALAGQSNAFNPETISLAGLTLGMTLIALVAVGGFTVLAQRRLRSLGMLAAQGATDDNVGLVVKANGAVVGVVGALAGLAVGGVLWLAYRPHLQASAGHAIGVWALPWLVVALAVVLAVVATLLAAIRPARAVSRTPIVAALAGRPTPPRQLRRSVAPGLTFLVIGFLLLGYSGAHVGGGSGAGMGPLVLGLLALIPAIILLSPFCLSVLARAGRRAPIAIRLALRDLDRYRARSGSALAAISLGVLIAVIIAIVAAARYGNALDYVGPNLASNQLALYTVNGPGYLPPGLASQLGPKDAPVPTPPTPSQLQAMSRTAHDLAASLGTRNVVELDATSATLRHAAAGRNWNGTIYVGTPALLRAYGINASQVSPDADVLTHRPGIAGLSGMQLVYADASDQFVPGPGPRGGGGPDQSDFPCPAGHCLAHPVIQEIPALPSGTAAPNTVVTEHAVTRLGLPVQTSGWLIQTSAPLTAAQIGNARVAAAAAGLVIETKNDEPTSDQVINLSTIFGVGLALAILAMSVGLIRSETASELRTLTAAGASRRARRTLTAATAGALGLAGALLGTFTGYVGVIGWLRSNTLNGGISALGNVPVANLLVIVVGMPAAATLVGWLLAGREPPAIAHQPIE